MDQEKYSPASPNTVSTIENNINGSNIGSESETIDSKENVLENSIHLKTQFDEDDGSKNKINNAIVGETIEESVMIVKGEGSGQECDTGNPDEINTQNETSKNEDVKKPKLWSIETICSSSKEVREENISVPTTGFFFGDDSVPCFNNVSNGESSCPDKKLEVNQTKERDTELNKIKKLDDVDSITTSPKQLNEVDIPKTSHNDKSLNKECIKNEEEFPTKNTSKQSVFNIKVHEEEVQITERNANEVFPKSDLSIKNDKHKPNVYESTLVDTHDKPHELNSTTHIFENNEDNDCNETGKCGTDNIQQNKITDECKKICVNEDSNITLDKQTVEQKDLSMKLEDEIEQLEENDQLTTKIVDQAIEIDKHVFDDKLQNIEQSTSEVNQSDKIEKIDDICEKDKTAESPANTGNQCADINDQQNIDAVEQNLSLNKTVLDTVDLDVTTDNQISTDISHVIDKEATANSVFEDSKINVVVSDNISKHIETTDEPEINAISSNYNLNQHTESDNSTLNTIDCSSNRSKVHDQTVVEDTDQSFKTYTQDGKQNSKINKKTLHNIRNIIETDMIVVGDNDKEIEQLTSAVDNKSKQLEHFQIKNENNFIKNFQEENKSVMNVNYQIVSSNKHSLDNIFKKSEEIKEEISECPKFEKETTEESKLKNKPEPSIVIEIDNIGTEKSEINIKELKNIDISNDLIEVKNEVKIIEDEIKTKDIVLSEPKQKEFIDIIDETGHNVNDDGKKNDEDEPPTISVNQCSEDEKKPEYLEVSYMDMKPITKEIKLNNKKEKHNSINSGNKTNICFDEKLKLKEPKTIYDKEDTVQDLVIPESTLTIDEENLDETLNDGKIKINIYLFLYSYTIVVL